MLNMGFIEDIEEIMHAMTGPKRVLLFSATMPDRIAALARNYMHEPDLLKVESQHVTTDLTNQIYFEVREGDKFDALTRIIDVEPEFYGIVFSRTRTGAGRYRGQTPGTRLCGRSPSRRHFAGPAREDPGQIQEKTGQYPGGYGRGGPGHRRKQPHARNQLLAAAGFRQLCPPHRTHGPRR